MNMALSALTGSLAAVMIYLNGLLAARLGSLAANLLAHASGLALALAVLPLARPGRILPRGLPLPWLAGGALGCLTVYFANAGFMRLGVSMTIGLGLLGQLLSSMAVDHFGCFGSPVRKFRADSGLGLAVMLGGILVMSLD
jgi:transporter family-2 protein